MLDHSKLPSVENARLPATYEAAQVALAECWEIDECKDWADRAAAMASYAKQADDQSLFNMAVRIQARAIRRVGELLKEYEAPANHHDVARTKAAGDLTRSEAADEAGLSERQRKAALRVADLPQAEFEALVESDRPPSVSKLAEMGTQHRAPLVDLEGRNPADFEAATGFISLPGEFLDEARKFNLARAWRGMDDEERAKARKDYDAVVVWITRAWEKLDGL